MSLETITPEPATATVAEFSTRQQDAPKPRIGETWKMYQERVGAGLPQNGHNPDNESELGPQVPEPGASMAAQTETAPAEPDDAEASGIDSVETNEAEDLSVGPDASKDGELGAEEKAKIEKLDAGIFDGDRLIHLRGLVREGMAVGLSRGKANELARAVLSDIHDVAQCLPNDASSQRYKDLFGNMISQLEDIIGRDDNEFANYINGLNATQAPRRSLEKPEPAAFGQVDQITYSTGAKHVYGIDEMGKKRHLSHDAILEAHGYSAKDARQEGSEVAARNESKPVDSDASTVAVTSSGDNSDEAVAKVVNETAAGSAGMGSALDVEPAKVLPDAGAAQPTETTAEVPTPITPEKLTDKERTEIGMDLMDKLDAFDSRVSARIWRDAELSVDEYTKLVEDAHAAFEKWAAAVGLTPEVKAERLAALEKEINRRKAQLDEYNEELAARKADVNDVPEAIDDQPEEVTEEKKTSLLRFRWNNVKYRAIRLMVRDLSGAFGSLQEGEEGQIITKRRVIGAAALVGVGLLMHASNRNGWGLDINLFDGDGLDINPFNKNSKGGNGLDILPEQIDRDGIDLNVDDNIPGGDSTQAKGTEIAQPDLVTVQVDPNEGTSHIARDHLGINFDTRAEWDQFNAKTNPLFEGVDGFHKDVASGEMQVTAAGPNGIPREILDQMQQAAEEIKKSKAA